MCDEKQRMCDKKQRDLQKFSNNLILKKHVFKISIPLHQW